MAEQQNRTLNDQYMLRLPDGMRDRLKALAKANDRSMNAEMIRALEEWLDQAEHAQQSAHEVANDLPEPAQRLGTLYLAIDAEGPISLGEVMANVDGIKERGGFDVVDMRVTVVTPAQVSSNVRKAEIVRTTERYRALARGEVAPGPFTGH